MGDNTITVMAGQDVTEATTSRGNRDVAHRADAAVTGIGKTNRPCVVDNDLATGGCVFNVVAVAIAANQLQIASVVDGDIATSAI